MKIEELHKAVLTAICSGGAKEVRMVSFTEDAERIEAAAVFKRSSSFGRLEDLNARLALFGFTMGKIFFGQEAEIEIVSKDSRFFKSKVAEACGDLDLFTEDDQTIREIDLPSAGEIIGCWIKHKVLAR